MRTWREIYQLPEYQSATDEQKIEMAKEYIAASQQERDEAIRSYRPLMGAIGKSPEDIQQMVMDEINITNALKYPGEEPKLTADESGIRVEPKSHMGLAALNALASEEKLIGKRGTDRAMDLLGRNVGATVGAIGQQTPRGILQSWQTDEEANAIAEAAGARGENPYWTAAKGTVASRTGPLDIALIGAPTILKGAVKGIKKIPEAISATKNMATRARNISAGVDEAIKQYNPEWLQKIGKIKEAVSDTPISDYYSRGKELVKRFMKKNTGVKGEPIPPNMGPGEPLTKRVEQPIINTGSKKTKSVVEEIMSGKKVSYPESKSYVKPEKVPGFNTLEDVSNIQEIDAPIKRKKAVAKTPTKIPEDYETVDRKTINRRLAELSERDRMAEVNALYQPEEFSRTTKLSREEMAIRELQDEDARKIIQSGELPFPKKKSSQPTAVKRVLGRDIESIQKAAIDENFIDIVKSGDTKSLVDLGISPSLAKKISGKYGKDTKITEMVNDAMVKALNVGRTSTNTDRFEGILEDFGRILGTGKRKGGMIGGD